MVLLWGEMISKEKRRSVSLRQLLTWHSLMSQTCFGLLVCASCRW